MSPLKDIGQFIHDLVPDFPRDLTLICYLRRRGILEFGPWFHEHLTFLPPLQDMDDLNHFNTSDAPTCGIIDRMAHNCISRHRPHQQQWIWTDCDRG